MKTNNQFREREKYGEMLLSVQASEFTWCEPRINGLPIDEYASVEVAFFPGADRGRHAQFPSCVGIAGFDHLFGDGACPVASYMSQADLQRLREALKAKAENSNVTR